jgi:hypothetical protein
VTKNNQWTIATENLSKLLLIAEPSIILKDGKSQLSFE